jgi:hypothetical protein
MRRGRGSRRRVGKRNCSGLGAGCMVIRLWSGRRSRIVDIYHDMG